ADGRRPVDVRGEQVADLPRGAEPGDPRRVDVPGEHGLQPDAHHRGARVAHRRLHRQALPRAQRVAFDMSKVSTMFRADGRFSMKLGMAAAVASVGVLGAAAPVVSDAAPRATSAAATISVKAKEFSY